MIDPETFRALSRCQNWDVLYAMLDEARTKAISPDDARSEVHWRIAALSLQRRHAEALDLLRAKAHLYNSRCSVQHKLAILLVALGRDAEALDELSKAPFDAEMPSFYALAMDAKFFYLNLLARRGNVEAVNKGLPDIPDDYQHITADGEFLTKDSIRSVLAG